MPSYQRDILIIIVCHKILLKGKQGGGWVGQIKKILENDLFGSDWAGIISNFRYVLHICDTICHC